MSPNADPPLNRMLEDLGRTGTPEDLARRGVGRVRSLSSAELSKLIRQSVNRTLLESTMGVEPAEIDRLSERAQAELSRLMNARRDLARVQDHTQSLPSELSRELGHLQEALREERAHREAAPRAPGPPTETEEVARAQVSSLISKLGSGAASAEWTEAKLLELFDATLRGARTEIEGKSASRLDVLERRLAKVVGLLDETEAALAKADENVERGLSSTYRDFQGLAPDDPKREVKERFLRRVLSENLPPTTDR